MGRCLVKGYENVLPEDVRPSDWAVPVSGEHEATRVLTVTGETVCLAVNAELKSQLQKSDYAFLRRVGR